LQLRDLFSYDIITRLALWSFIIHDENELCREIYDAFTAPHENDTFSEYVENFKKLNKWACSKAIIMMSMFL